MRRTRDFSIYEQYLLIVHQLRISLIILQIFTVVSSSKGNIDEKDDNYI